MNIELPPRLAALAGANSIEAEGRNLYEVLVAIEARYPALKGELLVNGRLRPGLAVALGDVISKIGLYEPLNARQLRFVPAIGGG